ncbi:MAG: hypothetical protein K1X61_15510 [Chitinophagales bacterium]|nr:hypothetical protein [Chitinophagales bacterium]
MKTKMNYFGFACLLSAVLIIASCSKETDIKPFGTASLLVDSLPAWQVTAAPIKNDYELKKKQHRAADDELIRFVLPEGYSMNETWQEIPQIGKGEQLKQR